MRLAVLYGIFVGLATGVWMFAEYWLGLHEPDSIGRWTGFLALIFPVYGAYRLARDAAAQTLFSSLQQGAVFGAVSGAVGAAAILAYFTWVNPGFVSHGKPVDASAQALAGLIGSLVLGLVLVPTIRAVLRRKNADERAV